MSRLRGTDLVLDRVSAKVPTILISGLASGTARTLNEMESGSTVVIDVAEGCVVTLPAKAVPGTKYEIVVATTPTANSHKIITGLNIAGSTLALLAGGVDVINVNDATEDGFQIIEGVGANRYVAITMNGTTTSGQVGTRINVTALSGGTWFVTGLLFGSGAMATPVATS